MQPNVTGQKSHAFRAKSTRHPAEGAAAAWVFGWVRGLGLGSGSNSKTPAAAFASQRTGAWRVQG